MPGIRTITAGLLIGCMALAACSSSTDGHGDDQKPPSHATLESIVLQADDVPSAWQASPSDNSDDSDDAQAQLQHCVGGKKVDDANKVDSVDSDEFEQDNNSIVSSASSYKTQAEIEARTAIVQSPKADSCFTKVFRSQMASSMPSGAEVKDVSFHFTPGDSGGPSNVVAVGTGRATVSVQGQTVPIHLTQVFIVGKLLTASVQFNGVGAPIDADLQTKLVKAVADRAEAA